MPAHRRTGSAFIEYLHEMGFIPNALYIVGVGVSPDEAIAFKEQWLNTLVVGWEPNPFSFEGLVSTFPGVLVNAAVSNEIGVADLHFRHAWKNGSTLLQSTEKSRYDQAVKTRLMRLDDTLSIDVPQNSILWLDCEGSELNVLKGAEEFLKNIQVINVEITGRPRGKDWCKPIDVHKFLKERGFVQMYIHSIRTVRSQFDAVYVRKEIVNSEMCACLDTLLELENDRNI